MSRLPIFAVLLALVLLFIAVAVAAQSYRLGPAVSVVAAAPTATPMPMPTATPESPTPNPPKFGAAASCPITEQPNPPFVTLKPWPERPPYGEFWYGSPALWTALRPGGIWSRLPHNPEGYTQKIFLWPYGGEQPKITVTGKRLDAMAPIYTNTDGTNACHSDFGGCVMLTSVDLPSLGCWELTIEHAGDTLRFVVWVGD
jgi:hypothetical protein